MNPGTVAADVSRLKLPASFSWSGLTSAATSESSGRRRALAEWIASAENPLTARVMVNRIWRHHFGNGIVKTTSDFGRAGTPPTHPQLLDWLAAEFMANDC